MRNMGVSVYQNKNKINWKFYDMTWNIIFNLRIKTKIKWVNIKWDSIYVVDVIYDHDIDNNIDDDNDNDSPSYKLKLIEETWNIIFKLFENKNNFL